VALTYSTGTEFESKCPEFSLKATDGKTYSLNDFKSEKVICFLFICNHCPYVRAIEDRIIELNKHFSNQNVAFIGVCSNDSFDYPEDSFENIRKRWLEKNYNFVYLYDEAQKLAKDLKAVCTPDIFVFNEMRHLVYRGRFDDSWKNPESVNRQDLKLAIEAALINKELSFSPVPSLGCSIKWK
jgi:peroxiredoxin